MTTLRSSNEEEILAITINRKLAFRQNIKKNLRKAGQIMSPSPRYVDKNKRRINILQFQSNYCRLVWVFCQRRSNSLNNKAQERAVRLTYNNQLTNFGTILSKCNKITIHQINLQVLMTEIFKVINNIVPSRICSLFETFENIHNASYFQILSSFRPLFSFTYNCNYGKYSRYFL